MRSRGSECRSISGGVVQWGGQAMRIDPGGACLRCLYGTAPREDEVPTCARAGVLGSLAGVLGALQASLALGPRSPEGRSTLHVVDGRSLRFRTLTVRRVPGCAGMRSARMSPDARIDITAEVCPMTFVRTRIALERLPVGGVLEVRLKGDEPLRNVPGSAKRRGPHRARRSSRWRTAPGGSSLRREGAGC